MMVWVIPCWETVNPAIHVLPKLDCMVYLDTGGVFQHNNTLCQTSLIRGEPTSQFARLKGFSAAILVADTTAHL